MKTGFSVGKREKRLGRKIRSESQALGRQSGGQESTVN